MAMVKGCGMKHKVHISACKKITACGVEFESKADLDYSNFWLGVDCEECLAERPVDWFVTWAPQYWVPKVE